MLHDKTVIVVGADAEHVPAGTVPVKLINSKMTTAYFCIPVKELQKLPSSQRNISDPKGNTMSKRQKLCSQWHGFNEGDLARCTNPDLLNCKLVQVVSANPDDVSNSEVPVIPFNRKTAITAFVCIPAEDLRLYK